jgi:hypothetical protein
LHRERKCNFEHLTMLQAFAPWCSEEAAAITDAITKELIGAVTTGSKRKSTKTGGSTTGGSASSSKKAAKDDDDRVERALLLGGMFG